MTMVNIRKTFFLTGLLCLTFLTLNELSCLVSGCLTNEEKYRSFDVRIENVTIPNRTTYYVCQQFKVPDDRPYHALMFESLIANKDLVHHILLFGCQQDIGTESVHECSSMDGQCASWLAQYTMGVKDNICAFNDTGVRFGQKTYSHFLLQVHYNNELSESGIKDNSGMRVYYTQNLRKYDSGNVQIGQNDLEILPGSTNIDQSGGCSSFCTQHILPHPIYITRTYQHMHYLGVSGRIEIYSEGKLKSTVATDNPYHYDVSPIHTHKTSIKVNRGDEIRVTCTYSNSHQNRTFYFGEGSEAEMCYAFITYYPRVSGFDQCVQMSEYDVNCPNPNNPLIIECPEDKTKFAAVQKPVVQKLVSICSTNSEKCSTGCTKAATQIASRIICKSRRRLDEYGERVLTKTTALMKDMGFYRDLQCSRT